MDVLEDEVRDSILDWFVDLQLRDYPRTFAVSGDQVCRGDCGLAVVVDPLCVAGVVGQGGSTLRLVQAHGGWLP